MSWALRAAGCRAAFAAEAADLAAVGGADDAGAGAGAGADVEMARPRATAARERRAMRMLKSIEFMGFFFVQGEGRVCVR